MVLAGWITIYLIRSNIFIFENEALSTIVVTECEIPCWNNLQPGQSSEQSLKIILKSLTHEKGSYFDYVKYPTFEKYVLYKKNFKVDFFISESTLTRINFLVGQLNYSFDESQEIFGSPSLVITNISEQDLDCYESSLFYPDEGVRLLVGSCNKSLRGLGDVSFSTPLISIDYVPRTASIDEMKLYFQDDRDIRESTGSQFRRWVGLGVYPP